jgi:small-conductance mechanosensitive channel
MEPYYLNIIETIIIVIIFLVSRKVLTKLIEKTRVQRLIQESRGSVIKRVLNIILTVICLATISLVWGVNQEDLAVLIGSVLTVIGIAFFAQWSLLSNVTSSVIIFFNHPLKLNDSIIIMEGKDYVIEGTVTSIGLFFVTLATPDGGELSLPNNVFIQKTIKKMSELPEVESAEEDEDEVSL